MTSKKRVIFFQACRQVADAFVGDGFKFIKSRQAMERKHSTFKDSVLFKSSISINKLPGHIHFEVRAYTSSQIMAEWQEAHGAPLEKNGVIGSATVENLFTPGPPYIRYDIGAPETRAKVLQRIISAVRTHALRFFDIARDPQQLCDALENEPIPAFSNPAHVIEYFLCTDNRALIPRYLKALNQQWPDLIDYTVSYHTCAQTEGIPEQGFSDAWGFARARCSRPHRSGDGTLRTDRYNTAQKSLSTDAYWLVLVAKLGRAPTPGYSAAWEPPLLNFAPETG